MNEGLEDVGWCRRSYRLICRICAILGNRRKSGDPCVYLPEHVSNRPDPCIYSQFLLMELGQSVTWDNPDVAILLGGVEQYTYDLKIDTEYELAITVHNSSHEKEANHTKVDVKWIEFGAGGQIRHHIDDIEANVPVWPGIDVVHTRWRTPSSPGHYCIEIQLSHPNDANPANNLGWKNTQVKAAASPIQTTIRVFNRWAGQTPPELHESDPAGRRGDRVPWNLVEARVDSYIFEDAYGREAIPERMFAPRPPAWPARLDPEIFHFSEDETFRDLTLSVDAPNGPGHAEKFNVNVWQGNAPLGGVTVTVTRS